MPVAAVSEEENGKAASAPAVAESSGGYDEEQWRSSFDEAEAVSVDPDFSAPPVEFEEEESGPVPTLEEMLAMIPERNQELLEGLFRGRFVRVQRLDRKNLF